MSNFFECNIPMQAPGYINFDSRQKFNEMSAKIHQRTRKLNDALTFSGLEPNTFGEYAAVLFKNFRDRFDGMSAQELAQSALLLHNGQYEAIHRIEWPNATVVVDCRFLTVEEWQVLRVIGIGGSDSSVLRDNMNPYRTPWELYMDKTMAPEKYFAPGSDKKQAIFDRGHAVEDRVIEAFCEGMNARRIPEHRMFASKRYPHNTANIDAIVELNGEIYVFEAKSSTQNNVEKWANGKIPSPYIPQMRQYPGVLDDDRVKGTFIGVLFTYDYKLNGFFVDADFDKNMYRQRYMPRDKRMEETYLSQNEEWFQKSVMAQRPPKWTGKPDAGIRAYTRYNGLSDPLAPEITLPEDVRDNVLRYLQYKDLRDAYKVKMQEAEDQMKTEQLEIIKQMGTSEMAVMRSDASHVFEVKNSTRRRDNVDAEKLSTFYPDVYAECKKPIEFPSFSIKEKDIRKRRK